MPRHILVPLDLDDLRCDAMGLGVVLARRYGAVLHLINSIDPVMLVSPSMGAPLRPVEVLLAERLQRLDRLAAELYDLPVTTHCEVADAAPFIEDYVRARGIDLVVLCTHGRRGMARLVLGSTCEQVVRRVPCPVLSVRAWAGGLPIGAKPVLVPTDFSAASFEAVDRGTEIAREFGASLHLLHIIDSREVEGPHGLTDDERRQIVAEAEHRCRMCGHFMNGVDCQVSVRFGSPRDEIVAYAAERDAGLIVMATAQRKGWERFRLGSVTEAVLRRSPCPLLSMADPSVSLCDTAVPGALSEPRR
jgi:nucleotide-binding universal stress UspA family protein